MHLRAILHGVFTRAFFFEQSRQGSRNLPQRAELTMPTHQDSMVNARQIDNPPFSQLKHQHSFRIKGYTIGMKVDMPAQAVLTQTPIQMP